MSMSFFWGEVFCDSGLLLGSGFGCRWFQYVLMPGDEIRTDTYQDPKTHMHTLSQAVKSRNGDFD